MKTCVDYKGLIDGRPDINESQETELASHLQGCVDCSDYLANADRTASLFRELRSSLAASAESDRAFAAFSVRLKESGRQAFWAVAGAVVFFVAALAIAVRGDLTAVGGIILLSGGLICSYLAWWLSSGGLAMPSRKQPTAGFYEQWRRTLERRIRLTTIVTAIVSAEIALGLLLPAFLGRPLLIDGAPLLLGFLFVFGIGVAHTIFLELPKLKRELALVQESESA